MISTNRTRGPRSLLLAFALAAGLGVVGTVACPAAFAASGDATAKTTPPSTTAAPAAPGAPQIVNSWSLSPAGSDPNQPGTRLTFSYALKPGAVIQDAATISNYGNVPLTVHLYATDALNTPTGDFALLPGSAKPTDAGSWVKLDQDYITVQPATSVQMPFTLTVPADAKPGDHTAGILATSQTSESGKGGKEVLVDRRVGSRVYLRVNGPVHPGLTVEDLSSTYHAAINPLDGSLDVRYTVRNSGNVRLSAHQLVKVSDVFGSVATKKPKDIPELLPGNSITLDQHFTGVAATLRVTGGVTLAPFQPAATATATTPVKLVGERTTTTSQTWAIPWTLVAVLLLILLAVALLRWRRRRRLARNGPGGSGGGGPRALPAPAPAPRTPISVQSTWVRIRGAAPTP